jgi:hypothetical protein
MRTMIVQGCARPLRNQLRLLAQRSTQRSVLDAQLIDEGTTLLPAPVRFVGGGQGGVEELRTGLERLYVSRIS